MDNHKLRVGILLDSFILPAWAFFSLERVVNLDCVYVSLLILNDLKDPNNHNSSIFFENYQKIAYRLLSKIDKAIFHRGPDAFEPKDAKGLFGNTPVLRIKPGDAGEPGCFSPCDITEIKSYQLDILLRMGFEVLTGEILTAARFGVWSYEHGDRRMNHSNLPGFGEIINRIPETSSTLGILSSDSLIGKVLYKSLVQTFQLSPFRNLNHCLWISSSFLSRQIKLLDLFGEERFFTEVEKYNIGLEHADHKHSEQKVASNFIVLWAYIRVLFRILQELLLRALFKEYWYLLFNMKRTSLSNSFASFEELKPPKGHFWADPHVIQVDNKYFIFFEDYIYTERKGRISVIEMEDNGAYHESIQVLSKPYHLSYPFVFEWNEQYYMVPETSQNRTIELYKCIKFPYEWKFKMNLMENVIAVDTTLFYYQEKWWLFTGITEHEGACPETELFLFYSKELFTNDWKLHPLSPVVADVNKARPAGKIYTYDGKIYRPSQDCSMSYGWGLNINEIQLLSETSYFEKNVTHIKPGWKKEIKAVHTFSYEGSLTVIDAGRRISKII